MTVIADRRVAVYWARQVTTFAAGLERLRGLDQTAVHPTRVAIRRLRSTLRTFAEIFEARAVERLDHELTWLGLELGKTRDREIIREALSARPDLVEPLRTPLLSRLDHELSAQVDLLGKLATAERTRHLLELLNRTVDRPPTSTELDLDPYLARARRILGKRLCRAGAEDDPERLHSARKAAKRARYAGEILAGDAIDLDSPGTGLDPERITAVIQVRRLERLQDDLGRYQDLVTVRDYLLNAADDDPAIPARPAFALARTLAEEQIRALVLVDRTGVCPEIPSLAPGA